MKYLFSSKKEDQRGEVMLEAAIIMVPIILLLMGLLSISFMFYEQSVLTCMTTEIAADVARTYKFADLDLQKSTLNATDLKNAGLFRMNFGMKGIADKKDAKAEAYSKWRIAVTSLGLKAKNPSVMCTVADTGIGRGVVKVVVTRRTEFFLSGTLEEWGLLGKDGMLFQSTAYAECNDLMGYTSTVNFVYYTSKVLDEQFSFVGDLYNSVQKLGKSLTKLTQ